MHWCVATRLGEKSPTLSPRATDTDRTADAVEKAASRSWRPGIGRKHGACMLGLRKDGKQPKDGKLQLVDKVTPPMTCWRHDSFLDPKHFCIFCAARHWVRHRHWVMSSPRLTIWTQSRHFPIERGARLFLLWNFHPLLLPLLNWELVAKSSQQCPDFGKKNDALEVGCACVKHPCLCPKRRVCPPTLAKSRHWSLSSFSESKREITRYWKFWYWNFWVLQ